MRKTCIVASVCLFLSVTALAQEAPRAEVFGGYQFVDSNGGQGESGASDRFELNGWNASLSGYYGRYFGLTADFAGSYAKPTVFIPPVGELAVSTHLYTFMGGPVIRIANPTKFQPFIHALFGEAHVLGSASLAGVGGSVSGSNNGFAVALGGGSDIKIAPLIGIRPVQLDFLQTHVGGSTENNIRYSAGIVLRF
jgi:opacity protein-like surface antigen